MINSELTQKTFSSIAKELGFYLTIVAFWCVIIIPTVLYSDIFPLDNEGIFNIGENFEHWLPWIASPYNGSGRYFPFFWIFWSSQYQIFAQNIAGYLIVQGIFFLSGIIFLVNLLKRASNSKIIALVFSFFAIFSAPVAENITSIGKAEPLTVFFIGGLLLLFFNSTKSSERISLSKGLLIALLMLLSIWTKETSYALLGFCISGSLTSLILYVITKNVFYIKHIKTYAVFFLYLSLGAIVSRAPYFLFSEETHPTAPADGLSTAYTSYEITSKIIIENFNFYLLQQPTVFFSLVISGALCASLFYKALKDRSDVPDTGVVFFISLYSLGIAFYLALLIWRWAMPYYMLLPAIIFNLCMFYGLTKISLEKYNLNIILKLFLTLSLTWSLLQTYYISSSQIDYSRLYAKAIDYYKTHSKPGQKLIIESYPFYAQQVGATITLLDVKSPRYGDVFGIADLLDPAVYNPELGKLLGVTKKDLADNFKNLPKKDDFLLVFTGEKLATWFLRGVTPYYTPDSILHKEDMYDMTLVDNHEFSKSAIFQHVWFNKLNFANTKLGYKIYRIDSNSYKYFWRNRYPDGWSTKDSELLLSSDYKKPVAIRLSAPSYNLPNKVTIYKNHNRLTTVDLTDSSEKTLLLDSMPTNFESYQFSVERTVSPLELKINKDKREIGVRLELAH